MNDITGSWRFKSTIYVYFQSKDDLFAAIMERERGRLARSMQDVLEGSSAAEEGLHRFGVAFAKRVTQEETVSALRTKIGVVPRMPKLSRRFFNDEQHECAHRSGRFHRSAGRAGLSGGG